MSRWRDIESPEGVGPVAARVCLALILSLMVLPATGCAGNAIDSPVVETRAALGTVVVVTAWGDDTQAVGDAVEAAFSVMADIEATLNAHEPSSAVSRFNERPYEEQPLAPEVATVLDSVDRLGVSAWFSPALLSVTSLYGFETTATVPAGDDLELAIAAANTFTRLATPDPGVTEATGTSPHVRANNRAVFVRLRNPDRELEPGGALAPGLDLGGAAKGLALERARETLQRSGAVDAAIISAGSTTLTLGTKPGGEPWRIGIEDPRNPDATIAVVDMTADGSVSTTGDYQRSFEVEGVRYHHVLDPATGMPVRGIRSLTVVGTIDGLGSDILSTALFVMGTQPATEYADRNGLGLFIVAGDGSIHTVSGAREQSWSIDEEPLEQP